ncbi:MAG: beta-galactosidase, partial [Bacteroidales bacterium]|nr:beta-galactosidase [Bacteroidales bacterium]
MFKSLFFLVGILASVAGVKETEVIRDLKVTSIGAVKPRTEFVTFNTKESALGSRYEQSPYYLSLNGTWDFVYFDDSRDFPQGIETPSYNGEWKSIKVPGNWERQGYGTAIYVNHPYEFKMTRETCPKLPEVIPGGVYHRKFSVPASWKGRDLYLNIDGAKAGVFVYVNGKFVGYGEDSKDRAQYKIDEYLNEGVNDLVLKIYRWCTGSYLECQDFWRVSGIERDVYLTSQAPGQMFDYEIVSTLDNDLKTGLLKVNIEGDATYELLDAAGKVIATGSSADKDVKRIAGVIPWSSEDPYLYKIVFCSKGEYTAFNVGFRRFEICKIPGDPHGDTQFLVNGQPMIFKGVNIHEHDENTGHYVDEALMRKDFELMKANNLNAFRTCHYPQPRRFYELADEYGIYVYCEANIESHGMGYGEASLAHRADFYDSHLSRTVNMYERCKNYPCVTIWSLGNEAGNGYN